VQHVAAAAWSPASDRKIFWGIFIILIAMGAWDLWRRRRIHPVVLFGAVVLWTGEIITTISTFRQHGAT
jgi:hypothetical protein